MQDNVLLIAGLHRSGTTLTTWLMNQAENCVALNEALPVNKWLPMSLEEIKVNLEHLLNENRQKILREKVATMKQAGNSLHTNSYSESTNALGLRESYFSLGPIPIEKHLDQNFLLAVKHNAAFTALMPHFC